MVSQAYQQSGTAKDHSAGDESVTDSFTITVTDNADVKSAPDTLDILITDTAPVANADTGTVEEDGAVLEGNVITDAGTGQDEIGADATNVTGVAKGDVSGEQSGGVGGTGVAGDYGTLTLNSDGTYSYVVDPDNAEVNARKDGETLTDTFSYTLKDADGDWSTTTLTITINGATDGEPSIVPVDENNTDIAGAITVSESGLASGTNEGSGDESASGTITITAEDGLASMKIGSQSFTLEQLENLTSTSPSETITVNGGVLVLTGFTSTTSVGGVPTKADLSYTYTLTEEQAHNDTEDDALTLDIPLSVIDAGNATSDGTLTVRVEDDTPSADADEGNLTEGATLTVDATNGVLSNDTSGADGWSDTGAVVGIEAGDTGTTATGGVGGRIDGQYGYITLNADGSYTYVSTANKVTGDETDVFTYTVRDGDGDETTATLTINVADVTGTPVDTATSVGESGLEGGSQEASDNETTSGSLNLQADWSVGTAQSGTSAHGTWTVDTDGTYSYTLTEPTSGDSTSDSFSYTAIDANGNTVTNTVTITINDDQPVAVADVSANVTEGATLNVEANGGVLSNDTAGADGWSNSGSAVIGVRAAGGDTSTEVSSGVASSIAGHYGTLTLNADGSYSYEAGANAITADDQDIFVYTVEDADGDRSTTTLTINIADVTGTPAVTPDTVDEAGLTGGSDEASGRDSTTGNLNLQTGWSLDSTSVGDQTGSYGTLTINGDGTYSYTLTSPVADIDGADETETFTYTAVDQYGNTVENTVTITIVDDEPEVTLTGTSPGSLTVDETALGVSDTDNGFANGVFGFAYGADGEDSTVYSLSVTDGTVSGVTDTATGTEIYLFMDGADVVGRVGNDSNGDEAFRIAIDADTGAATLTQSRPLEHSDASDHDDPLSMTDGTIQLVATVTDGDGDSASESVNVGKNFSFRDDGPSISIAPADGTVDEAHLPQGSATTKDSSQTEVSNSLNVEFGTDNAGDVQFTEEGAGSTKATLEALGLKSGGEDLVYNVSNDGHTLTAYKGSVAAGNEVFTVEITDPAGIPGYKFTLSGAIDHINEFGDTVSGLNLEFGGIEVTDGDDDSVNTGFTITVMDDAPEPTDPQIHTVDEDSGDNIFITNADATDSNTSIGDGSGTTVAPSHGTATVNDNGTITYIPDDNYSGTDTFTYTTVTDNQTKTYTVEVTVNPESDAPTLTVDAENISTEEDTAVALGLRAPEITDDTDQNGGTAGDDPERLGPITLSGLPEGAVLNYGSGTYTVTASGSVTIELSDLASGDHLSDLATVLTMSTSDFESMTVTPPAHSHENFTVEMSVTSYEVDASGSQLSAVAGATSTTRVQVRVQAVTDDAALVFNGETAGNITNVDEVTYSGTDGNTQADVTLKEDTTFDLTDMLSASFEDLDGSEVRSITITNPGGNGTITVDGKSVAAGESITIDASGQTGGIDSFRSVQIGGAGDFSGDLNNITVTVNAQDKDADGWGTADPVGNVNGDGVAEDTSNNSVTLNLHVTPVAGDVNTSSTQETDEDTAVKFLSGIQVTDDNDGTEVITKISFDTPTEGGTWTLGQPSSGSGSDWTLTESGGTYTITFDNSLTEAQREAILDEFTLTPPGHSSLDAEIAVEVTSKDTQTVNGSTVTDEVTTDHHVAITVKPVAERADSDTDSQNGNDVDMTAGHAYTTTGTEDQWFTLGTENGGFNLEDGWSVEDGEELFAALTPELTATNGTQTDAAGSQFSYTDGSGNTITQTFGGDAVRVPVEYLDSLQFKAPENFSGQFKINVQAVTVDTDDDGGESVEATSGNAELTNILIEPKADEVTTAVTARVQGDEDDEMPLSIRPSSSDPSETFDVTIDAIPNGAVIKYDGQTLSAGASGLPAGITITNNGDGTWKVDITDFDSAKGANMTLTPPEHSNEPFSINVTPKGVADKADVEVVDPSAQTFVEENVDIAGGVMLTELLDGAPSLLDSDGSETLSFKLSDLPEGFGVEGATSLGNGEWVFAAGELGNVKITTPANFSGTSAAFTLAAVTTENDGDSFTENHSVQIRITPSPEATMNLSTGGGEDTPAKLDFSAQQQSGESDETITEVWIKASDLDGQNFTLTYGEDGDPLADGQAGVSLDNGWYKLTGEAINSIYMKGNANWSGDANFTVQYRVEDPGDDGTVDAVSEMSEDQTYSISVVPVTDQPDLTVTSGDISMIEAGVASVSLNIANEGGDYDGSEQLTRILLDNVPEGVIVEGADFIGGNQWLFITDDSFDSALTPSISLKVQSEAGGLTDHEISITVTTEDAGNGQLKTDSTTVSLTTNFPAGDGSQEPAEIIDWSQTDFDPTEDTAFTLSDAFNGKIQDGVTDNGFNITLSNLPEGTVVTGMTSTVIGGETVWTASGTGGDSELKTLMASITITSPVDWNSNKGNFDFDAKLTTYVPSGLRNEEIVDASFTGVQPVSDEPEISISAPAVDEGSDLTFAIDLSNGADDPNWTLVGGKLYLQLDESGIDGTGVLEQGGTTLSTSSVSGVTGVADGNYYVINVSDPASTIELTYTASGDHVSGSVSLTAWAQSQEAGSSAVETGTVTQVGVIDPVNSGYDFAVAGVSGTENASQLVAADKSNVIQLNVTDSGLEDSDGSESIGTALLSNVPDGFLVFVGDSAENATEAKLSNNAGGDGSTNTWLLGNGEIPAYIGIMAPQYWSGTVSHLKLQVTSGEDVLAGETVTEKTFNLTVNPQADGLTLAPTPSFGEEGDIVPLNLNHELKDPDSVGAGDASTETLTLEFSGMGENAAFYLGNTLISGTSQVADNGGGSYTISGLTTAEAETLGFVQAANDLSNVQVRAQTEETGGGDPSLWTDRKNIDTSGITQQYGTTGDDSLIWTGEGIDAFGGEDVVALRFGEDVSGTDLAANLNSVETLDLNIAGSNQVSALAVDDVIDMTDEDNELSILGGGEDSVSLSGNWTQGATDDGFVNYSVDGQDAVLKIMESVQVTIE